MGDDCLGFSLEDPKKPKTSQCLIITSPPFPFFGSSGSVYMEQGKRNIRIEVSLNSLLRSVRSDRFVALTISSLTSTIS